MKLLFACTLNRTRSPMAEALAAHLLGPDVEVMSCGLDPCEEFDPFVFAVLSEIGVALDDRPGRGFESLADHRFDVVVCLTPEADAEARRLLGSREAIAEFNRAVTLSERNTRVIATLGHAYGLAGRRAEAQTILNELRERSRQTYVSAFYPALVYAGLGMREQALEQLEKAVEERQPYLAGLNVEPSFLHLHDDPGFQAIVHRIGIPTAR